LQLDDAALDHYIEQSPVSTGQGFVRYFSPRPSGAATVLDQLSCTAKIGAAASSSLEAVLDQLVERQESSYTQFISASESAIAALTHQHEASLRDMEEMRRQIVGQHNILLAFGVAAGQSDASGGASSSGAADARLPDLPPGLQSVEPVLDTQHAP
jgi:hypothetical protein